MLIKLHIFTQSNMQRTHR